MKITLFAPPDTGCTIASGAATTNYNHTTYTSMLLGESNSAASAGRWLLKFNGLSDGSIPFDAKILKATLTLTILVDRSDNARTCRVFRTKRAWVASQATWNKYTTSSSWSTAGGFNVADCEQTDIGTCTYTATDTGNKTFDLSPTAITDIVRGNWTNNGFLFKFDTESSDGYQHATASDVTVASRPKLEIIYTTPNQTNRGIYLKGRHGRRLVY